MTLAGGLIYANALTNRSDASGADETSGTTPYTPVTLTIAAHTSPWNQLAACQSGDVDITGLSALLTSSDDADGRQDGPFTAIVSDPRCPMAISVTPGDGTYGKAR
jgi:hypothetical protein